MVRHRKRERTDLHERRVVARRPPHTRVDDLQVRRRQDVVDPQVPDRGVIEVRGVLCRIAGMGRVPSALELGLLGAPGAGRRRRPPDPRMTEEGGRDGAVAIAVVGVVVQIADQNERLVGQRAGLAAVVPVVRRGSAVEVVQPEPDLVVVPQAVVVVVSVERRRGRVADEEVDGGLPDGDRDVGVGLRGQTEVGELLGRVPVVGCRGRRVVREHDVREVLPEELLERPDVGDGDRPGREHQEAVLSGERPEPETVVAVGLAARRGGDGPVVPEVVTGRHTGVDRRGPAVRVGQGLATVLGDPEEVLLEPLRREPVRIVVELVQQHHVRTDLLEDRRSSDGLRVSGVGEVLREVALRPSEHRHVERREPDPLRFGRRGRCGVRGPWGAGWIAGCAGAGGERAQESDHGHLEVGDGTLPARGSGAAGRSVMRTHTTTPAAKVSAATNQTAASSPNTSATRPASSAPIV